MSEHKKSIIFNTFSLCVYGCLYFFSDLNKGYLLLGLLFWYALAAPALKVKPLLNGKYRHFIGIAFMILVIIYILSDR